MAQLLRIKQENVSRLERRNNIHLSTLKNYIHALGGKLHIIVELPNQEPIEIQDNETVEV
ncbi:Helix-turn-helix domain-containing protein (fragment) [Hyella patelloides LEGE 07179]|uniref:Helix-turn-helix domain-containing protein n=1 Tax=Hyella patelloides LEGE 07179 TaxID=945734 RepID=A0A563W3U1_9CYAN